MNKRVFAIVVLSALCITMILAVPTNSLVGYYDPWLDYDENGNIDMKDVAASARAFGSLGEPTKNVTVTNWPTSSQVVVWFNDPLPLLAKWSPIYNSFGFCRMHILVTTRGLNDSESVTLRVNGLICDVDPGFSYVTAYTITLTATADKKDATIFVPSERFCFTAINNDRADADISLNFYLTWA